MKIIERPIEDVKPYAKNAKEHPEKQIKKIADSIKEFGWGQPIVVDKNNVIIVGHGRYIAAQLLGLEKVPVLEMDLDEEHAKAYRLADNKLNESSWDMDLVIEELKSISLEMVDLTGFDSNLILETKEDEPNLVSIGTPRTELGDVYELGPHRLVCGDSTLEETYMKLLGAERPRLIFTDPPYSIDYHSVDKHPRKGKVNSDGYGYESEKFGGTGGRIFNDDKSPAEALEFYKKILTQIYAFSSCESGEYKYYPWSPGGNESFTTWFRWVDIWTNLIGGAFFFLLGYKYFGVIGGIIGTIGWLLFIYALGLAGACIYEKSPEIEHPAKDCKVCDISLEKEKTWYNKLGIY